MQSKRDHGDKLVLLYIFALTLHVVILWDVFKYCRRFSEAKIVENVQPSVLGFR